MRNLLVFLISFVPFYFFSQDSYDGEWIECEVSKDGLMKYFILDHPLKEDNRDAEDWYSDLYPNSNHESIKIWAKLEGYDKKGILKEYTILLFKINLITNKYSVEQSVIYDKTGNILSKKKSNEYDETWETIIPNTMMSSIYDEVKSLIKQIQSVKLIKDAFSSNDKAKICSHFNFPLAREYPLPKIETKEQLRIQFDELLDKSFIDAISNSEYKDWDVFKGKGLIMFLNGELWIDFNGKIKYLTYQSEKEKKHFEEIVTRQKKLIHPSINQFEKPENVFLIDTSKFRIDLVSSSDGNIYRLSAWNKSTLMNKEPLLIIDSGTFIPEEYTIRFTHDKYYYDYYTGGRYESFDKSLSLYLDSNELFDKSIVDFTSTELENEMKLIEDENILNQKLFQSNKLIDESIQFINQNKLKNSLSLLKQASNIYPSNKRIQPILDSVNKQISFVDSMRNYRKNLLVQLENKYNSIFSDTLISNSLKNEKKSYFNNYLMYMHSFKSKYDSLFIVFKLNQISFDNNIHLWDISDVNSVKNILTISNYLNSISDFQRIIEKGLCLEEKKILKLLNLSLSADNLLLEINNFKDFLKLSCNK